jgi:hypothetical protein
MARRRRRPRCIVIAEPNGAGKTTFAIEHLRSVGAALNFWGRVHEENKEGLQAHRSVYGGGRSIATPSCPRCAKDGSYAWHADLRLGGRKGGGEGALTRAQRCAVRFTGCITALATYPATRWPSSVPTRVENR